MLAILEFISHPIIELQCRNYLQFVSIPQDPVLMDLPMDSSYNCTTACQWRNATVKILWLKSILCKSLSATGLSFSKFCNDTLHKPVPIIIVYFYAAWFRHVNFFFFSRKATEHRRAEYTIKCVLDPWYGKHSLLRVEWCGIGEAWCDVLIHRYIYLSVVMFLLVILVQLYRWCRGVGLLVVVMFRTWFQISSINNDITTVDEENCFG